MSAILHQGILEANKLYASTFDTPGLDIRPRNKLVICKYRGLLFNCAYLTRCNMAVSCMDCRLDPALAYGFKLGDTTVVRNAGACARDGARSLLVACHILGADNIFVIKHTRCGLLGVSSEAVREAFKKNLGVTESKEVDSFDVGPISDLEKSAEEDVKYLREHPLGLKHVHVTGWIHDTDSGLLKKVME